MGNQKPLIERQTIQQSKEKDKRINNDDTKHYTEN